MHIGFAMRVGYKMPPGLSGFDSVIEEALKMLVLFEAVFLAGLFAYIILKRSK